MSKTKVAVLVPDGAADVPLDQLEGRTPLQAARIPNMDQIAALGAVGTARTIPVGMPPGSDVANLSLFGYDPGVHYGGRGPIEAANLGIKVPEGWTAFRCNLVSTDGERMADYSAGHISQKEAENVVELLQEKLGDDHTRFFAGKSYRHIALISGDYGGLECTPPHDITGEPLERHMPRGEGAKKIIEMMMKSREILGGPGVSDRSSAAKSNKANMIWLWGQGTSMELEPFKKRFGLKGGVISAVDLVNGLGKLIGLKTITVPGITGFLDTNYAGKGESAVKALSSSDFVYVHVEAPDEASHIGDAQEKVLAIERFDSLVVEPVWEFLQGRPDYRILVCPDHPTFISTLTHDGSPVPYALCGTGIPGSGVSSFCEESASKGGPHFERGWELMSYLTGKRKWPDG